MEIPCDVRRQKQYGSLARVLAHTASALGPHISSSTEERWVRTTERLAKADDMSEVSPGRLDAPSLLEILGIENTNPALIGSAANLLAGSIDGRTASNIPDHFRSRELEAVSCAGLLRHQSDAQVRNDQHLWREIRGLIVFGTHLDSFADCQEDAAELTQFTAGQLATGALVSMGRTVRKIEVPTLLACREACAEVGIQNRIIARLAKAIFGLSR